MIKIENVLVCAVAMSALWTVLGLPIAQRLATPWLWAPAIGWAIHNVVVLPIFSIIGMSRLATLSVTTVLVAAAMTALVIQRPSSTPRISAVLILAVICAGILALAPAAGVVPKPTATGVTLAPAIFDHSKIALIDEMVRSGVPAKNAFFGEIGAPEHVAYYYLWHFSAAVLAVMLGVSGWEADAALTWFTGMTALLTMIGLATWIGGRSSAAFMVVMLAATASLYATLVWIWPAGSAVLIGWAAGIGAWLVQTSWAPQHVASATCVVITCSLLTRMADEGDWWGTVAIGLLGAAAFESSVWVGGVVFIISATAIGLYCLCSLLPQQRAPFIFRAAVSAAIAAILIAPFAYDQFVSATLRNNGMPIAFIPVYVFGTALPQTVRRLLDLPGYWLIFLPTEFPAFYPAGLIGIYSLLHGRMLTEAPRRLIWAIAIMAGVSLVIAWLLASLVSVNNDLGWRALLPAIMVLIPIAAAVVSRWPAPLATVTVALMAAGTILSLPEGFLNIRENVLGFRKPSEPIFAATPAMWAAVRRHAAGTDRVANNPNFLGDMTPLPANISWALLADRRSCYAGNELAIPFAAISPSRRAEVEMQFARVFAGDLVGDDVAQLAEHFRCDVILVTPQDGAWLRDPFASTLFYRLVENQPNAWRIYRRTVQP